MPEISLFIVFRVIWQDLLNDKTYNSMNENRQVLQVLIKEIEKNKQVAQDFAVAIERCLFFSDKMIAEKCREELTQKSTFVQYRGAKFYKPPENDTGIKCLDKKIKSLEALLKKRQNKKLDHQIQEIILQLSSTSNNDLEQNSRLDLERLLAQIEQDCDVDIYKKALREEGNQFQKHLSRFFLQEIERKEVLNSIFNAKTYLTINQMFAQYKQK